MSSITRRQFLGSVAAAPLVAISVTSAYAGFIEPHYYEVSQTDILIPELPDAFEGFRIAQISDVHHSTLVAIDEVRRVVELAQATKPDLIALTGDYTTSYRRFIEPCAEELGRLHAPQGVWAVLGNHDYYTDAQLTSRALKRVRINLLENANTVVRMGSDSIQLAGIDDWSWAMADWQRAFDGINRRKTTVLLSHQPIVFDHAETQDVSLILSGHTHGGQICLPFIGAPARFEKNFKYISGLYRRNKTQLYVSRGTGVIGLPLRLGARPEIAMLQLKRGSAQASHVITGVANSK